MCKIPHLVLPCGHIARQDAEPCSLQTNPSTERCQYQSIELRRPPVKEEEKYLLEGERCIGCRDCFRSSEEFAVKGTAMDYPHADDILAGESASGPPTDKPKRFKLRKPFRKRKELSKGGDSRRSGIDCRTFSAEELQQALASKGVLTQEEKRLITVEIAFEEDNLDIRDIMEMTAARVACRIALDAARDIKDARVERIWELVAEHFGAEGDSLTVSVDISKSSTLPRANPSYAGMATAAQEAVKEYEPHNGLLQELEDTPAPSRSDSSPPYLLFSPKEKARDKSSASLNRSTLSKITEDQRDDVNSQMFCTEPPSSPTKSKTPSNNPNLDVPRRRLQKRSSDTTSVDQSPSSPGDVPVSVNAVESNKASLDTQRRNEQMLKNEDTEPLLRPTHNQQSRRSQTWTQKRFKGLVRKLIGQSAKDGRNGEPQNKTEFPDPVDLYIRSRKSWRDLAIFSSLRRTNFKPDPAIHQTVTSEGFRKSISTLASRHSLQALNFRLKPRARSVVVEHRLKSQASESGWRPKQFPRNYLPRDWAPGKLNIRNGSSRSRHYVSPQDVIGTAGDVNWGYPVSTRSVSSVPPEKFHHEPDTQNRVNSGQHHDASTHEESDSKNMTSARASVDTYRLSTHSLDRIENRARSSSRDWNARGRSTSPAPEPRPRNVSPPIMPPRRIPLQQSQLMNDENWPLRVLPSIRFDRQRKSTDASYAMTHSDKLRFPAYHRASGELSPQTTKSCEGRTGNDEVEKMS